MEAQRNHRQASNGDRRVRLRQQRRRADGAAARLAAGRAARGQQQGAAADAVTFDAPLNGWRHAGRDAADYTQEVHYPAVAVSTRRGSPQRADRRAHPRRAQGGERRAGTGRAGGWRHRRGRHLVVNGVAMPQRVEEDGASPVPTPSRPAATA